MRRENYITIQGWMVTELGLSGNELLCYALIYGFSQDGISVFNATMGYVASWLNVSRQTAIATIKKLCEKGLISKVEKIVNGVVLYDYRVCQKSLQGVKNFDGGCQKSLQGCQNSLHNNYIDNNKDNNPPLYPPFKKEGEKKDNWEDFEEFWSLYPKQRIGNKQKAYSSYIRVLKEKRATHEQLLSSVKAYADSEEVRTGYAKGCQAWLNDDRFNIDYNSKKSLFEGVDWK